MTLKLLISRPFHFVYNVHFAPVVFGIISIERDVKIFVVVQVMIRDFVPNLRMNVVVGEMVSRP